MFEEHRSTIILRCWDNDYWSPLVKETVIEVLDKALCSGNSFGYFDRKAKDVSWLHPQYLESLISGKLFDEDGDPLGFEEERWELIQSPDWVIRRNLDRVSSVLEGIIYDNVPLLNALNEDCYIFDSQFLRRVPNHLIFDLSGWVK